MCTQPMLIGPLGENAPERRRHTTVQDTMQEYVQSLSTRRPQILIDADVPATPAAEELLSKVLSRFSDVTLWTSESNSVELLAERSRPVIEEIDALRAGREDEVIPTEHAYRNARSIVESAYGQINSPSGRKQLGVPEIFPKPLISTDDVGGIRLSWRTGTKQVRANFGANPELRSYVYFEHGREHAVEELDPQRLSGRLTWLTAR